MITLEQFATIHISTVRAMGDRQKEIEICKANGITIEEWERGKAFYYAKMTDLNDAGKTAMALAQAAMNNLPNMTQQFLNGEDGSLRFSDTFSVTPSTTIEALIDYFGEDAFDLSIINDGWHNHQIKNVQTAGKYFIFRFFFKGTILCRIDIHVQETPFDGDGSWDNWNLNEELELEKSYDNWITEQVGSLRKFDWGTIHSIFDERGGSSFIMLTYIAYAAAHQTP